MQCPKCNVPLRQTDPGEHGFVVLDTCEKCKGSWFDAGELNRLDDSVWTNVEEHAYHEVEGDHQSVACPKCDVPLTPLSPKDAEELIVDRCPSCDGFWLDAGELDRIADLASHIDAKLESEATVYRQPEDWSLLKWTIYQYKTFVFK